MDVVDAGTGKVVISFDADHAVEGFSADGSLFVTPGAADIVRVRDADPLAEKAKVRSKGSAALSTDGHFLSLKARNG